MPIFANLVIVDFNTLAAQYTPILLLGYIVKSIFLFGTGGFIGYLHTLEIERYKLFEIGLGVAAIMIAFANGMAVPPAKTGDPKSEQRLGNVLPVEATAYAAQDIGAGSNPTETYDIHRFTLPPLSPLRQFYHGFTGRPISHVWFVLAANDLDL